MKNISTISNLLIKSLFLTLVCFNLGINTAKSEIPIYLQNDFNGAYEFKHNCNHYEHWQNKQTNNQILKVDKNQLQNIDPTPSNYDVLKYELYMDWSNLMNPDSAKNNRRNYDGTMKMIVVITENNVDSLEFNSEVMNITSAKINNIPTRVMFETTEYLNAPNYIYTDKTYKIGDIVVILIDYTHIGTKQSGLHFYTPETPNVLETITYTMSEPELARIWMPCKDRPDDKALSKITVKVPKGYEVISNGSLIKKEDNATTTTYIWENNIQIPTYLMHVISSKYFKWADYYKPKNNPNDSIEVSYYAWEQDMPEFNPSSTFLPRPSMSKTVEMIGTLAAIFNEYPYQKYAQAAAFPFPYGGMEHQTITTIHRNWLKNNSELGVVHEVGHHWLGNMISCATWNDIWINEGGASWIEWLWVLHKNDVEAYNNYINYASNTYFNQVPYVNNQAIYGIPPAEIFNNKNVYLVYTKAGLVYNMLYKMLGEEFISALRNTLEENKFTSMTTNQLKESLKKHIKNSPIDIDVFFEQWIMKPAHPILQLDSYFENINGKYKLTAKLNQIQKETLEASEVTEVFKMPVNFIIDTDNGKIEKSVIMDTKYAEFTFELDNEPLDINVDLTQLIAIVNKNPMGIENESINQNKGLSIFPNPSKAGENIQLKMYHLKLENELSQTSYNLINSYEIYDLNGKILAKNNNVYSAETIINTNNFEAGIYIIRVNTPNKTITTKFSVIK